MESRNILLLGMLFSAVSGAQNLNCDLAGYKPIDGLKALGAWQE